MTDLFLKILNMSISAGILVLVILLLRLMFRKVPKWLHVLLWGLAAVRLLLPFPLESSLSLMPKTDWILQEPVSEEELFLDSIPDNTPSLDTSSPDTGITGYYYYVIDPEIPIHRSHRASFALSCIWLAGIGVMLLYLAVSCFRVYRRIRNAKWFRDNIYTSETVPSPFVFGVIRPHICLPENMDAVSMSYVIAHEEAHIRRRDHWWKPFGFLLLTVHWFNPLIWLGYILLCRDIELACDERVVREMDDRERADYSEALLECSVKRGLTGISACPLAFGEVGVKQRIKSVLHYKKPAFWIVTAAVISCAAVGVCFLTNPPTRIDYVFEAEIVEAEALKSGKNTAEHAAVRVSGEIERNFWGKASFHGEIVVDGLRFDNDVDLSQTTPILSYYAGSRLFSEAYLLAYSANLDKMTIVLQNPRKYVFCNMTLEEALMMQKVPELSSALDIIPAEVVDTSYEIASGVIHPLEKNGYQVRKPEKNNDNMIEIVFMAAEANQYVGVFWMRETKEAAWTMFPTPIMVYDPGRWDQSAAAVKLTLTDVISLSAKGQELTWSDFEGYIHTDTGSGLYIRCFPIDEVFSVKVGGGSLETAPMYIRLCAKNGEEEEYIDIREGKVEEFLQQYRSSGLSDTLLLFGRPISDYVNIAWEEALRIGESAGITIDRTRYQIRHDHDGGTIWIQFYGLTESGSNDKSLDIPVVRGEDGTYSASKDGANIISQKEIQKRQSLYLIGENIRYLETVIEANPHNYTEDIPRQLKEYEKIFQYGESLALEYIFGEFLAGGQTDLHGFVMHKVMLDLLNENERIAYDAENGQDYFDKWLVSARSVGQQHNGGWLEENVPAIALVLKMADT